MNSLTSQVSPAYLPACQCKRRGRHAIQEERAQVALAVLLLLLHAADAERLPHLLWHRTVEYQHQKPDDGAEQSWERVKKRSVHPFIVMSRFG